MVRSQVYGHGDVVAFHCSAAVLNTAGVHVDILSTSRRMVKHSVGVVPSASELSHSFNVFLTAGKVKTILVFHVESNLGHNVGNHGIGRNDSLSSILLSFPERISTRASNIDSEEIVHGKVT